MAFDFGPFRADLLNQELLSRGSPVALTPKSFETLVALLERAGQVVSKEDLLETVWPKTFVEESVLTQNIYTLRKVLAEAGGSGRERIETLPRRGYRFAGSVIPVSAREDGAGPGAAGVRSLAVLPFLPLQPGEEDEILGLAMADALITRLSRVRRILVRPTSAVRAFTQAGRDPIALGRSLGVDAVVDGTLLRFGERLRLMVQMVSLEDLAPLWASRFDAVFTDIFSLQDSISEQVTQSLQLQLTQKERSGLTRRSTADPAAYEAYVKGRFFWNKRTADEIARAIGFFRQATQLDPEYAAAYAGLADSYVLLPFYGQVKPQEAFPKAIAAATQALRHDDSLAEAHTSLAYARFFYERDWERAGDGFRHAIDLNPGYPTAHHWYAYLLAALGRFDEALASAHRAQALDPLSLVISADLGFVSYFSRRYGEAILHFRKALELDPEFGYARFGLAFALVEEGQPDEAVRQARRGVELSGASSAMSAGLGFTLAAAGHREEAEAVLADLRSQPDPPAGNLALVLAGLDQREQALDCLEAAVEERSRFLLFLNVWPAYDRLRSHPRFEHLVERVGVPPAVPTTQGPGAPSSQGSPSGEP